jgi:hypothetical protein
MRSTAMMLFAAVSLGACSWTTFDDLEGETWVDSTGKSGIKSSDYGLAIQRGDDGSDSPNGGRIGVIGADPNTYSELVYDAEGSAKLAPDDLTLSNQGILQLNPSPPLFIASSTGPEIALVTAGDQASIVVAKGDHTAGVLQIFIANTTLGNAAGIGLVPDAATYVVAPPYLNLPAPPAQPLVGVKDVVLGTIYGLDTRPQPACRLTDGAGAAIEIRALGVVRAGMYDDVLAWSATNGKLLRYPNAVFNGCTQASPVRASRESSAGTSPAPGHGSQILTIDQTRVLVQGHEETSRGNASVLQVYDANTLTPIGSPITFDGLRSAAVLDLDGTKYAVAGYPTAMVNGKTAGQVMVFKIGANGLDNTPVATLHDAQPENGQVFGRSVTVMPFRGRQVIAVAANNEIFVYFRVQQADGSDLYGETRQGK